MAVQNVAVGYLRHQSYIHFQEGSCVSPSEQKQQRALWDRAETNFYLSPAFVGGSPVQVHLKKLAAIHKNIC